MPAESFAGVGSPSTCYLNTEYFNMDIGDLRQVPGHVYHLSTGTADTSLLKFTVDENGDIYRVSEEGEPLERIGMDGEAIFKLNHCFLKQPNYRFSMRQIKKLDSLGHVTLVITPL